MQVLGELVHLGHDVRGLRQRGVRRRARDLDANKPLHWMTSSDLVLRQELGLDRQPIALILQRQGKIINKKAQQLPVPNRF